MLELILGLLVIAITLWLIWRKHKFSYFKNLNIPGPEPSILFGNLKEVLQKGPLKCHEEWVEKHGKVFGYYYGLKPVLMVADIRLLKNIQQKDFHTFPNRPTTFDLSSGPDDRLDNNLIRLKGKQWKDIRSILTPTFTSSKLKQMSSIVYKAIDEMIEILSPMADTGKTFNIYDHYQRLTMDVIGRTAFGIQTNVQKNDKDPFLDSAKAFLSMRMGWLLVFAYSFSEFSFIFAKIRSLLVTFRNEGKHPSDEFAEQSLNILNARRQDPKNRVPDLLQLMMEAEMSTTDMKKVSEKDLTADVGENETATSNVIQSTTNTKDTRKMTDNEIISNSITFFLAGYETTSTALSFITHFLVNYPDVQERVRNEINELLEQQGTLDYVLVQQLKYLDQVVNESLRFYPPIYLFVNRQAVEDIDYGSIHIKKDMVIQVAVYYLHHDSTLWENPEEFDPDRFHVDNKQRLIPLAWQPFGAGPRNCIGMRFALMEEKMAIAMLLKKYRLVPGKDTEKHPLALNYANAIIRPANGIKVKLEKI